MKPVDYTKSQLESLALVVYQSALDDAITSGLIELRDKKILLVSFMNNTIEFEVSSFMKRQNKGQ